MKQFEAIKLHNEAYFKEFNAKIRNMDKSIKGMIDNQLM